MKLYYHPQSGHSHRVILFLSLIGGVGVELIEVDLRRREQDHPEFLALNPFHQVPVLDDDGTIVADSNAILVYLAKKYAATGWLPEAPAESAAVQRWLSVAAGEVARGPCAARLVTVWNENLNGGDEAIGRSHDLLKILDKYIGERGWLALDRPTIADVALYTYIAHAPEGFVDLSGYGNVRAWLERVEALPRFIPLVRTPAGFYAEPGPSL